MEVDDWIGDGLTDVILKQYMETRDRQSTKTEAGKRKGVTTLGKILCCPSDDICWHKRETTARIHRSIHLPSFKKYSNKGLPEAVRTS